MKFITANIKRRHFYSRPAGQEGVYERTHCAYANFDLVLVLCWWCSCARARNVHVHGLVYTHAVNVHVYVCAQLHNLFYTGLCPKRKNEWNKCKNHFNNTLFRMVAVQHLQPARMVTQMWLICLSRQVPTST